LYSKTKFKSLIVIALATIPCLANSEGVAITDAHNKTEQMLFADDPALWARPKKVVPPDYPAEALANRVTGYVDADVSLSAEGKVASISSLKSNPPNQAFEASVMNALPKWRFQPTLSDECKPKESSGNVRIWFEIKEGKASISVSNNYTADASSVLGKRRSAFTNMSSVMRRAAKTFPIAARKGGIEAEIYNVLQIDAKTGNVRNVTAVHISTSADEALRNEFVYASSRALFTATFQPQSSPAADTYLVCMPVSYLLDDRKPI
jgi:TonB family protein